MSKEKKIKLCTSSLSVSQSLFSAFWRPENAISALSSTGLIKAMNLDILVLGFKYMQRPLSHFKLRLLD